MPLYQPVRAYFALNIRSKIDWKFSTQENGYENDVQFASASMCDLCIADLVLVWVFQAEILYFGEFVKR